MPWFEIFDSAFVLCVKYRIYSFDSLAPVVANLRIYKPLLLRRISAFLTRYGMSHLAVKDLINWLSQLY